VILVVEDSPDDEALIVHALEDSRLGPVTVTHDGAEALEYLRAVDQARPLPDVVLLDMNLPRVKGLDVLREIRAAPKTRHVPVVILTSSAKDDDIARSYELGANSFVGKPPDPRRFADAVCAVARYWLRLSRAADVVPGQP
jgi:two-component system response regulator